uniref:BZIP domain-containing protein n=2 Tax=Plectus sambesii TaxID=2011161 RepID=A0A914X8H1_9BILA
MAQRTTQTGRKPVARRRLGEWLDALLLLAVVQSLCLPYQTLDRHFARSRLVYLLDSVMSDFYPMQPMEQSREMDTPSPASYSTLKLRSHGLRWRDDEYLARVAANLYAPNGRPITLRPLLEARNTPQSRQFDWGQNASTSNNEPSLEDIDLIDVLWRQDIDVEKGNTPFVPTPAEQYERDLQLLTEKSFASPLSTDENWLYENLSKAYYEDFYLQSQKQASKLNAFADLNGNLASSSAVAGCKLEPSTPTDEELDALLQDVEKGDLNLPEEQPGREQQNVTRQLLMSPRLFDEPILNNVSLAQAMRQNSTNATDFVLHEFFTDLPTGGIDFGALLESTIPTPTIALNETDANYWFSNPQVRSDVQDSFAHRDDLLEQQSRVRRSPDQLVPSSGDEADLMMETMSPFFDVDSVKKAPLSAAEASLDQPCSSGSASSPDRRAEHDYVWNAGHYAAPTVTGAHARTGSFSEDDEDSTGSRVVGKLLPAKMEMDEDDYEDDIPHNSSPDSSASDAGAAGARRRGRQSKDEQLARSYNLPVTAADIAAMTLTEFQRLLRSDELNDAQRALIRKIRRRGKNKVAARTCRQRRGANMVMLETETSLLAQERNVEAARHAQLTDEVNREVELIDQLERELDE